MSTLTDINLADMDQDTWDKLPYAIRQQLRSDAGLSPQLKGLEGCRVEVVTLDGEKRRFWVGRTTGWIPCHLEIHNRRSLGGYPAETRYKSVTVVARFRR